MKDEAMEEYNFDIEEELKKLPAKPGVYLMHDEKDHIIYVGKAISLKNRVRQYFQSSRNKGIKIEQMVTHIRRFEYIVTDSELEALVLECNLIKEHRPKYNTMLMDDRAAPQAVSSPELQSEPAQGYRKGKGLPELSYPSVRRALPGIHFPGRICQSCFPGGSVSERAL